MANEVIYIMLILFVIGLVLLFQLFRGEFPGSPSLKEPTGMGKEIFRISLFVTEAILDMIYVLIVEVEQLVKRVFKPLPFVLGIGIGGILSLLEEGDKDHEKSSQIQDWCGDIGPAVDDIVLTRRQGRGLTDSKIEAILDVARQGDERYREKDGQAHQVFLPGDSTHEDADG